MTRMNEDAHRPKTAFALRRLGVLVAVLAGLGLFVVACGGSNGPGVANLGSNTPSSGASPSGSGGSGNPLAYAQCMRTHGIKDFPDPDANGGFSISAGPNSDLNPNNAQFQAATKACQHLQGGHHLSPAQQAQAMAQLLKYSACMRAHGIKDFPDPKAEPGGGIGISLRGGPGSDLDPSNPQFQAARKACQSLMPGKPGAGHTTTKGSGSSSSGSGATVSGGGQ
jgi:hypothetical protein